MNPPNPSPDLPAILAISSHVAVGHVGNAAAAPALAWLLLGGFAAPTAFATLREARAAADAAAAARVAAKAAKAAQPWE